MNNPVGVGGGNFLDPKKFTTKINDKKDTRNESTRGGKLFCSQNVTQNLSSNIN